MAGILDHLHPPLDTDYVEQFQRLADLNLKIKRSAASAQDLLQKSLLETALGNHHAAHRAAQDARLLRPDDPEILYQVGVSSLLLAFAQAGALECPRPGRADESLASLLEEATQALDEAASKNGADDDARDLLTNVQALQSRCGDDAALRRALRGEHTGHHRPPRPQ